MVGCRISLFAVLVVFQCLFILKANGFLYGSTAAFVGLTAPLFSIFLCDDRKEPLVWLILYIAGCAIPFAANLSDKTRVPQDETLPIYADSNVLSVAVISIVYLCIFWFVVDVYVKEKIARRSLEEELEIFTRLSHEIRTPLTIICGMVELIQGWRELSGSQQVVVGDLASASRRLKVVVNDLLSYSQSSPGAYIKGPDDATRFSIRDVVDEVVGMHLPQAEASELDVYLDIPSDLPLEVHGGKARLTSVLDQLLSNAVKFTQSGFVTIKVRMNEAATGHSMSQPSFTFTVQDTGVGINLEALESIFHPFVQAMASSTREFDGMGLGLTLAYRMVSSLGGTLQASSGGPGKGSAFSFAIPLEIHQKAQTDLHNPLSVVVLDDDDKSFLSIEQICRTLGISPHRIRSVTTTPVEMPPTVDIMIFMLPTVASSSSDAPHPLQSSIQHIISFLPTSAATFVVGSSSFEIWARETMGCQFLRKPLALRDLRKVLRRIRTVDAASRNKVDLALLSNVEGESYRTTFSGSSGGTFLTGLDGGKETSQSVSAEGQYVRDSVDPVPSPPQSPNLINLGGNSVANFATPVRVLCCDDNPIILRMLTAFIQSSGFAVTVETASNGTEAINAVTASALTQSQQRCPSSSASSSSTSTTATPPPPFSIIFLDFNMPNMSGSEVTLHLRRAGHKMPIIGITAATDQKDLCLASGMTQVLFKPFTAEQIREVLDKCL